MLVTKSGVFGNQGSSPWLANQAISSAEMVARMVQADLKSGDLSEIDSRLARIEEIVGAHVLEEKHERNLLLLAARLLDASGRLLKVNRVVGQLRADESRLQEPFYSELRRFACRVALNRGDVKSARREVDLADRTSTENPEALGGVKEQIDREDTSAVSTATWLLSAEVALAEGDYTQAHQDLLHVHARMRSFQPSPDESVMFELLSALLRAGEGDGAGAPALAYLYHMHVVLRAESPVEAATSARVAAAAGDLNRIAGINQYEANRWRKYGPEPEAVEAYLRCETPPPPPAYVLAELPAGEDFVQAIDETFTERRRARVQGEHPGFEDLPYSRFYFPISFLLEHARLDSVTSMIDMDLLTGPLLVDWAGCEEADVREAIEVGAISAVAARVKSGTIYFNNGAYVDATFDSDDADLLAVSPTDVIFELFRIGMARLPKSGACLLQQGPEAAHIPELVNLRPNRYNPDILRRFDELRHLAGGGTLPVRQEEEKDIEEMFSGWTGFGQTPSETGERAESQALTDAETAVREKAERVDPPSPVFGVETFAPILQVMKASNVSEVCREVENSLLMLGLKEPRIVVSVSGHPEPVFASGPGLSVTEIWSRYEAGPLDLTLSFRTGQAVSCPEAVDVVLNTAAQRLRNMPGEVRRDRIEISGLIAFDPATLTMLDELREISKLDGTTESQKLRHILIVGERGTGKELIARAVHNLSRRAGKNFRVINLGALPKELAPSEIFGRKRGAFTGATDDRPGHLKEAEGGTLFLDELDEADDNTQALLKRVVQFGTYNVIGSPEELQSNVRFVAATNRLSSEASFIKEDLRDRFWEIKVPPLRERRGDIRPLAEYFASEYGWRVPETVLEYLERLDWRGNVRQLQNVVERACALANSADDLTLDLFQHCVFEGNGGYSRFSADDPSFRPLGPNETLSDRLESETRKQIEYSLRIAGGNRKHAADMLGRTRQWLGERMHVFGIPDFKG